MVPFKCSPNLASARISLQNFTEYSFARACIPFQASDTRSARMLGFSHDGSSFVNRVFGTEINLPLKDTRHLSGLNSQKASQFKNFR